MSWVWNFQLETIKANAPAAATVPWPASGSTEPGRAFYTVVRIAMQRLHIRLPDSVLEQKLLQAGAATT